MEPFAGKRVVVTGAGRDFGRAVAVWLAREGAQVDLCARGEAAARRTAADIARYGGSARAYGCDLGDAAAIRAFAAAVTADPAPLDILVLSAAPWLEGGLDDGADDAAIAATVAAGLTGQILLTRALLPALRRSAGPDIVAMVSVCGRPGFTASAAHPAFYAAKHGLSGFCEILGARLRPEGFRIIAAYPPDFTTPDPLAPHRDETADEPGLTGAAVWASLRHALLQPRPCTLSALHFAGPTRGV